jgi:argininosuccinate synthase
MTRTVLAYSGGLETSIAIPWLRERSAGGGPGGEVVAVIVDFGRQPDLVERREHALALGAVRCHVVDVRDRFVRELVLPALQAGAFAAARSPMVAAIARPLIARTLVDIARMEGAGAVAFGGGSRGRLPLESLTRALADTLKIVVPSRTWDMADAQLVDYARAHGVMTPGESRLQKISANLWGRSLEFDPAHDAWDTIPEDVFTLTRSGEAAPNQPAYVELEFDSGVPVRVNGIEMPLVEMIESLEIIAGTHGVGRSDTMVTSPDGTTREIAEAPAAAILQMAHAELLSLAADVDLARRVASGARHYSDLIREGHWFSPARDALDAVGASAQSRVSGVVRLRLYKGDCRVAGRRASSAPPVHTPSTLLVKAHS